MSMDERDRAGSRRPCPASGGADASWRASRASASRLAGQRTDGGDDRACGDASDLAEHAAAVKTIAAQLFYAALEIRSGVEARLQEYLSFQEQLPINQREEWNVTKLHRSTSGVFKIEDQVAKVAIFSFDDDVTPIITLYYTPVTTRLKSLAERFNNYLHASKQFHDDSPPYWGQFRTELAEAIKLLNDATFGTMMGPMMFKNSKTFKMNVWLPNGESDPEALLPTLKGQPLVTQVRYFDDLASARDAT